MCLSASPAYMHAVPLLQVHLNKAWSDSKSGLVNLPYRALELLICRRKRIRNPKDLSNCPTVAQFILEPIQLLVFHAPGWHDDGIRLFKAQMVTSIRGRA